MHKRQFLKSIATASLGSLFLPAYGTGEETIVEGEKTASGTDILAPAQAPASHAPSIVRRGPHSISQVVLTYDDGPTPRVTETILEELREKQLKATFFMIGERVKSFPKIARRVVDEGHEVGNHTYTHPVLSKLSHKRVVEELKRGQEIIFDVTGQKAVWFRPPYGAFRPEQVRLLEEVDLRCVMWSLDPQDWAQPGEAAMYQRIVPKATGGDIILLHDLRAQTARATPHILKGLLERQLEPVPMRAVFA
ncbi:MAG: polysaccharide deacetylase family protein [Verrucomicrobiota bacterium]|nr:polysaccharide deacetylase family protein [Verrucomicrobiota bacterium]